MPNHITTKIEFFGEMENIQTIMNIIKGENGDIDFNKIIPMPKTLQLPSGSERNNAIWYALSKKSPEEKAKVMAQLGERIYRIYKQEDSVLLMEAERFAEKIKNPVPTWDDTDYKGLGITNFEDLGNAYINNIIAYGESDWYKWRNRNWGIKWNAYNISVERNTIYFDTAWACPFSVLNRLADMCYKYDVQFEGKWADEDMGTNVGYFEANLDEELEYSFYYDYVANGSSDAYAIYVELKGESECLYRDNYGNWFKWKCDECPHKCY